MMLTNEDVRGPLKAEHELLLACCRTVVDDQTVQRVHELLRQPLDWEYLFAFGRRHGLLPLFYFQLSKIPSPEVPTHELARLKLNYQQNAARNLLLTDELCRILRALSAANIEAFPYKGPALAVYAYGNVNYRRFLDLDVMVRKSDVWRAKEILIEEGYTAGKNWTKAQHDLLLRTQHNLQFMRDDGKLVIELHWEVASGLFARSMEAEALWERLVPMDLHGESVKTLAPEDLLLALCVHGSKHLWERLSWICDVAELLRLHRELDWNSVWQRAKSSENQRMLALGLSLANRLFEAPLSEWAQTKVLNDSTVPTLLNDTCNRIFQRGDQELISIQENVRFNFKLRDSWRARWRYFRLILQPTDADVGTVTLPQGLGFGYYLLRPFRFLRQKR